MSQFDQLTDVYFHECNEGVVFYPWGKYSKGYILGSQSEADQLRGFIKKANTMGLVLASVIQCTIGIWGSLSFLALYTAWFLISMNRKLKNLPRSTEMPDFKKKGLQAVGPQSTRWHELILLEVGSIMLVALGIWQLHDGGSALGAWTLIILFGLVALVLGPLIVLKKLRLKKSA